MKLFDCEEPEFPFPTEAIEGWRPIVAERRVICALRGIDAFGNFTPLWTNGVLAQVRRIDGTYAEVHFDNIIWPERPRAECAPRKVSASTKKPKIVVASFSLAELLE